MDGQPLGVTMPGRVLFFVISWPPALKISPALKSGATAPSVTGKW